MELCSNGHDEVCYECKNCPVCEAQEEKEELEKTVETLEGVIESLKNEIAELK